MMVNTRTCRMFWIGVFSLIFLLAACGGNDDDSGSLQGGSNNTGQQPAVSESSPDNTASDVQQVSLDLTDIVPGENTLTLPAIPFLEGRLIFVQGNTDSISSSLGEGGILYLADFEGGEPQQLASRVYAPTAMLSPDKTQLLYTAVIGRHWFVHILNLETLETRQLIQTQNQFNFVNDWSPDGKFVTMFSFGRGQILIALDGSGSLVLGPGFSIFTQDNMVLWTGLTGGGQGTQGNFTEPMTLVDPTTMETEALSITVVPAAGIPGLITSMRGEGYELSNNSAVSYFNGVPIYLPETDTMVGVGNVNNTGQAQVCSVFELGTQVVGVEESETLAQYVDTLMVSDLDIVDEAYFFERWYAPDCNLSLDTLSLELVRQTAGQEAEVILTDMYAGDDINIGFLRSRTGRKYFLSPDSTYVIWISGALQDQTSAINITYLADGNTAPILTWTSGNLNSFLTWEAFNSVFWIP